MTDTVLHIDSLTKRFGRTLALDEFSMDVARGEIHGFLGPNGAGKSTTIRVLLGLLKADGGHVTALGFDPWRDAVHLHRSIAYVPGDVTLWPGLTGGQAIDLITNLRGGADPARRAELIELFDFDPTKRGRQYSKGNRQKVAIIAALAAPAELYIFDEPTSGLDPLMEKAFQDQVRALAAGGATVLLSSHILSEVEHLADRVTIIRKGRAAAEGTLDELRRHVQSRLTARMSDGSVVERDVEPHEVGALVAQLNARGIDDLTVEPPSLESLFLHLYEEQ